MTFEVCRFFHVLFISRFLLHPRTLTTKNYVVLGNWRKIHCVGGATPTKRQKTTFPSRVCSARNSPPHATSTHLRTPPTTLTCAHQTSSPRTPAEAKQCERVRSLQSTKPFATHTRTLDSASVAHTAEESNSFHKCLHTSKHPSIHPSIHTYVRTYIHTYKRSTVTNTFVGGIARLTLPFLRLSLCLGMRPHFVISFVISRALFACYRACCLDDGEGADGDTSNHNITR